MVCYIGTCKYYSCVSWTTEMGPQRCVWWVFYIRYVHIMNKIFGCFISLVENHQVILNLILIQETRITPRVKWEWMSIQIKHWKICYFWLFSMLRTGVLFNIFGKNCDTFLKDTLRNRNAIFVVFFSPLLSI